MQTNTMLHDPEYAAAVAKTIPVREIAMGEEDLEMVVDESGNIPQSIVDRAAKRAKVTKARKARRAAAKSRKINRGK